MRFTDTTKGYRNLSEKNSIAANHTGYGLDVRDNSERIPSKLINLLEQRVT